LSFALAIQSIHNSRIGLYAIVQEMLNFAVLIKRSYQRTNPNQRKKTAIISKCLRIA